MKKKSNARPTNPQFNSDLPPIDPQALIQASQPKQLLGWPTEPPLEAPTESTQIASLQQANQRLQQRVQQLLDREQVQSARIQALYEQLDQRDAQSRHQELRLQAQTSQSNRDHRRAAVLNRIDTTAPAISLPRLPIRSAHSGVVRTCLNVIAVLGVIAFGYGLLIVLAGLLQSAALAPLLDIGEWVIRVSLSIGLLLGAIAVFSESL